MIGDMTRDFSGYKQIKFSGDKTWKFIIYGFSDNDCTIAKWFDGKEIVPIDSQNRITVLGKKYSSKHWYH
jgi:hypothetical protein